MKEVVTLSDETNEYYLVRLTKQRNGKREDAPAVKWVVTAEVGTSHSKPLASGEWRTYNNFSYSTTLSRERAARFKDVAKAKRAVKVKFFQPLYDAGWTYQIIRIVDRVRTTREETVVVPLNPLLALAQEAI